MQDAEIEDVIRRALAIASLSDRHDYLDSVCKDDEALRVRIEAAILEREIASAAAELQTYDDLAGSERPGDTIGNFRLIRRIGQGGFGTVWLAHQEKPVRRHVALKVIKVGMDTRQVVMRFEQERQALAMMDHPHIARVLDAGATSTGRPYFAMELVSGVPIAEYCDEKKLPVSGRLEIAEQVCGAVAHAHAKGVIHRDIKPSNILVGEVNGKPHATIIDFGIAKAAKEKLTEATVMTEQDVIIGTLAYMSPEQAAGSTNIDTRTDIYSLGVVLYELLTGSPPFSPKALSYELQRMIRDVDPPPPSARVADPETTAEIVAASRQTDIRKLRRIISGDLDWIIMCAMEKDPSRRYATVDALLADLRHYLAGEPVAAAPPSRSYRLKKFVRRHRVAVAAAVIVVFTLVAGIIGTTLAFLEAKAQREIAEKRSGQLVKANEVLASVFSTLDPLEMQSGERPLTAIIADKLDEAIKELSGDALGDPMVVAEIQSVLGKSLVGLLAPEKARGVLEQSVATYERLKGPQSPETLLVMNSLAIVYTDLGRFDDAVRIHKRIWEGMKAQRGIKERDTLMCGNNLSLSLRAAGQPNDALALIREVRSHVDGVMDPCDPFRVAFTNNHASICETLNQLEEAQRIYAEALETMKKCQIPTDHPGWLTSASNLGNLEVGLGNYEVGVKRLEAIQEGVRKRFGYEDLRTQGLVRSLSVAYTRLGRSEDAMKLLESVYRANEKKLGPDHRFTLTAAWELVLVYSGAGALDAHMPWLEEISPKMDAVLEPDAMASTLVRFFVTEHALRTKKPGTTLEALEAVWRKSLKVLGTDEVLREPICTAMAGIYDTLGRPKDALAAVELIRQPKDTGTLEDFIGTLLHQSRLAAYLFKAGEPLKAQRVTAEGEKLLLAREGLSPKSRLDALRVLTDITLGVDDLARAERLIKERRKLSLEVNGPNHRDSVYSQFDFARLANKRQDLDGELAAFLEGIESAKAVLDQKDERLHEAMIQIGSIYNLKGNLALASRYLNEALAMLERSGLGDTERAWGVLANLGNMQWQRGDFHGAVKKYEAALERALRVAGPNSLEVVTLQANLAFNEGALEHSDRVVAYVEPILARLHEVPQCESVKDELLVAYARLKRTQDFDALLAQRLKAVRAKAEPGTPDLASGLSPIGQALMLAGRHKEAEKIFREMLGIRMMAIPEHWVTSFSRSLLGWSLMEQKDYTAAKPLLLEGYQGVKKKYQETQDVIVGQRLRKVADRIVRFYELTGDAENLKKWQQERAGLDN